MSEFVVKLFLFTLFFPFIAIFYIGKGIFYLFRRQHEINTQEQYELALSQRRV